jgi:hypothetical protein
MGTVGPGRARQGIRGHWPAHLHPFLPRKS